MPQKQRLPTWLKTANRLIIALNHLGVVIGTQHVLVIQGRKTGNLRSTPVSVLRVGGERYIVTVTQTDWAKNARAAGWGYLTRGRTRERVTLSELPVAERGPILREFPRQVPHGVQYFEQMLGVPNDPEAFAAAAPQCPVFRVDPATPTRQSAPAEG